ncbi:hypothetical protein [Nannocystis pusilla]|uniref:hypothetical protein n=1 Tax=Nannocystis pusilla TaxID=889268 RepID=UPI003B8228C8
MRRRSVCEHRRERDDHGQRDDGDDDADDDRLVDGGADDHGAPLLPGECESPIEPVL